MPAGGSTTAKRGRILAKTPSYASPNLPTDTTPASTRIAKRNTRGQGARIPEQRYVQSKPPPPVQARITADRNVRHAIAWRPPPPPSEVLAALRPGAAPPSARVHRIAADYFKQVERARSQALATLSSANRASVLGQAASSIQGLERIRATAAQPPKGGPFGGFGVGTFFPGAPAPLRAALLTAGPAAPVGVGARLATRGATRFASAALKDVGAVRATAEAANVGLRGAVDIARSPGGGRALLRGVQPGRTALRGVKAAPKVGIHGLGAGFRYGPAASLAVEVPPGGDFKHALQGQGRLASILPHTVSHGPLAPVANALKDAVNLPANAIPMVYLPAAAIAHYLASGDGAALHAMWDEFRKNDALGALSRLDFAGFARNAAAHPLYAALELGGAYAVGGRTAGRLAGSPTHFGSRQGVKLEDGSVYPRQLSPNLVTAIMQRVRDRATAPEKQGAFLRQPLKKRLEQRLIDYQMATEANLVRHREGALEAAVRHIKLPPEIQPALRDAVEGQIDITAEPALRATVAREVERIRSGLDALRPVPRRNAEARIAALEAVAAQPAVWLPRLRAARDAYNGIMEPLAAETVAQGRMTAEQQFRAAAKPVLLARGEGRYGIDPNLGIVEHVPGPPPARIYHGTKADVPAGELQPGPGVLGTAVYHHGDQAFASRYGPNLHTHTLAPDTRVANLDAPENASLRDSILADPENGARIAQAAGYDAATITRPGTDGLVTAVYNPAKLAPVVPGVPPLAYTKTRPMSTPEIKAVLKQWGVEPGYISQKRGRIGGLHRRTTIEPNQPVQSVRTGASTIHGTAPSDLRTILRTPQARIRSNARFDTLKDLVEKLTGKDTYKSAQEAADFLLPNDHRVPINVDSFERRAVVGEAAAKGNPDAWDPAAIDYLEADGEHVLAEAVDASHPGTWKLIDRDHLNRIHDHLAVPRLSPTLARLGGAWKRIILTTTPTWYMGNASQTSIAALANGLLPPPFAALAEARGLGAAGRGRALARIGGERTAAGLIPGGLAETSMRPGANMRLSAAEDERLAKWFRSIARVAEDVTPRRVATAFDHYSTAALTLNAKVIEEPLFAQLLGKVAAKHIRSTNGFMESLHPIHHQALKDFMDGMHESPSQLALADAINKEVGNWHILSPFERMLKSNLVPFYMWHRAALRFVFLTMPRQHPVISGILAAAANMTADERAKLGLDLWRGAGKDRSYLSGGIPVAGGIRQTSNLTAFGMMADYPGAVANSVFPLFRGGLAAAGGVDWKGDKYKHADGKPLDAYERALLGAYLTLEPFIPFAGIASKTLARGRRTQAPLIWYQGQAQFTRAQAFLHAIIPTPLPGSRVYSLAGPGGAQQGGSGARIAPGGGFDRGAGSAAPLPSSGGGVQFAR